MKLVSNYLQQTALAVALFVIAFGLYQYSPVGHSYIVNFDIFSTEASSTVTISAEQLADYEQIALEHRQLQAITTTSTKATNLPPRQLAAVIARPPQSPYDTLVLNIGSEDGVRLDAGVWWPAGVYLGKVIDVRFRSAVVQLLSAPGVIHPASISATPVTTLGQGGGEFYAEVPQDRAVSVGTVIISDQYNLPLGVVAATQIISATNMQALYITRFVSAASLEYVYVEK